MPWTEQTNLLRCAPTTNRCDFDSHPVRYVVPWLSGKRWCRHEVTQLWVRDLLSCWELISTHCISKYPDHQMEVLPRNIKWIDAHFLGTRTPLNCPKYEERHPRSTLNGCRRRKERPRPPATAMIKVMNGRSLLYPHRQLTGRLAHAVPGTAAGVAAFPSWPSILRYPTPLRAENAVTNASGYQAIRYVRLHQIFSGLE
jgi:hypothetical protein